jgi:hypothetical protein
MTPNSCRIREQYLSCQMNQRLAGYFASIQVPIVPLCDVASAHLQQSCPPPKGYAAAAGEAR